MYYYTEANVVNNERLSAFDLFSHTDKSLLITLSRSIPLVADCYVSRRPLQGSPSEELELVCQHSRISLRSEYLMFVIMGKVLISSVSLLQQKDIANGRIISQYWYRSMYLDLIHSNAFQLDIKSWELLNRLLVVLKVDRLLRRNKVKLCMDLMQSPVSNIRSLWCILIGSRLPNST